MSNGLRVGIVGASGIGQHHARWHALSGSDVVAFVGTSETTVARTRLSLKEYFGFSGKGYTSLSEMLDEAAPDLVSVTSPYVHHKAHVKELVDHGVHILCEKPLVWDEEKRLDEILADGRDIVTRASAAEKLFGMTAQYPACLPMYGDLYASVRGEDLGRADSLTMEMEVKQRGERKLWEANWIDVASHPLSLVIAVGGLGSMVAETAICTVEEAECTAAFTYVGDRATIDVTFAIRDIVEGTPLRRFGVNGFLVDWDGFADEDGVYRASLTHGDHSIRGNDFLHTMIDRFSAAALEGRSHVLVGPEEALLNLELQVELLRKARVGTDAA